MLVVRNTTVIVELAGLRVLVDPSFAPGLGAPGVWQAPPPAVLPEAVGRVDVVLVTGCVPGGFDVDGFARLDARGAAVLVADEATRRRVARIGQTQRVRMVVAGDVVRVGPLVVTASPARSVPGDGLGFHLAVRGSDDGDDAALALWHTGMLPPLEVDARVVGFAADHPADVVLGVCSSLAWRGFGPAWSAGLRDVVALARRAGASSLVPLGRDVGVAPLLSGLLDVGATADDPAGIDGDVLVVSEPAGTWLRPSRRLRRGRR